MTDKKRTKREILEDVAAGKISVEEAEKLLQLTETEPRGCVY